MAAFGTRPEAIKMAPVIEELLRWREQFQLRVCTTAQHRHMLAPVKRLFRFPVHYDLNVMRPDQRLGQLTAHILEGIPAVLKQARPDVVLVQGDTTTTLAVSLAAFYERIPVAHIEAGLRTYDPSAPYPEEVNRRLTTQLADYHFAPTHRARQNILNEGIPANRVFVTGNTVIDAFLRARLLVLRRPPRVPGLNGLAQTKRKLILVTAHRRENFGPGLEGICEALRRLALTREDIEIVYPVHPNPNVRTTVDRHLSNLPHLHLIEPLDYLPFVWLITKTYLVLTDSGGLQEEMPSLGRPVLVLREKTERPEGIEAGVCQLVGTNPETIIRVTTRLLDDPQSYRRFTVPASPFGDGAAAGRIVDHLARLLNRGQSR